MYQGGIIACLDGSGLHGLIVAANDQSKGIQWHNENYIPTNAWETSAGTGRRNTSVIISAQGTGRYAAELCAGLALNGYNDWFLPGIDELDLLYQNRNILGGFSGTYWSSSEYRNKYNVRAHMFALSKDFNSGICSVDTKRTEHKVRAVRVF
jgi:hypothetical protein